VTKRQFQRYYDIYRTSIAAIARKLGGRDDDLVADLEQEGALALWLLDLRAVSSNEDAYVRQCLKFRMIDHLRRYNPSAYDSLDAQLESGAQVDRDDDTGALRLLRGRSGPGRREDED
jgi:DNA-directed RNA polymerase specialized sigma24 family protein